MVFEPWVLNRHLDTMGEGLVASLRFGFGVELLYVASAVLMKRKAPAENQKNHAYLAHLTVLDPCSCFTALVSARFEEHSGPCKIPDTSTFLSSFRVSRTPQVTVQTHCRRTRNFKAMEASRISSSTWMLEELTKWARKRGVLGLRSGAIWRY